METKSNYFIVGADGREYGPATTDDLRRWVGERRANARSKVRLEGETEWTALGAVPGLADLLEKIDAPASSPETGPPPALGPGEELAETVFRRDPVLNIGDCFSRGWSLLFDHPGLLIGSTALVALLIFGVGSVPVVGVATALAFLFVLLGGLNLVFLRHLRGQSADIGIVFAGFSNPLFVPLLLAGVIASALSVVGLMLCLVPGIYLIVCWGMYAPLLVIDKRLDFWQALECSRRVVTRYWWPHFGLFLLALLVACAGVLAVCVGVVVTLPLALAAMVVAYEDTFGEVGYEPSSSGHFLPAPEPNSGSSAPARSTPSAGAVEQPATPPSEGGTGFGNPPPSTGNPSANAPTEPRLAVDTLVLRKPATQEPPRSSGPRAVAEGGGKPKRVRKSGSTRRTARRSKESPES